jgi:hypothetical protein
MRTIPTRFGISTIEFKALLLAAAGGMHGLLCDAHGDCRMDYMMRAESSLFSSYACISLLNHNRILALGLLPQSHALAIQLYK